MPDGTLAPNDPNGGSDPISSAEQALARLLFTLAQGRQGGHEAGRDAFSLARLAKRSELPMSDLLRYLSVLSEAGWVDIEDGERGLRLVRLTDTGRAQYSSLL